MSFEFRKVKHQITIIVLALFLTRCAAAPTPGSSLVVQLETATETSVQAPSAIDSPTSKPAPTEIPAETQTPSPSTTTVTIAAHNGNLNIRRGPGISYNPIGVLKNGQTSIAQGRDLLGNWVLIEIPSSLGKTGWVRTETDYSLITGDIESLPEVVVDFAVPAYIQNCTYHLMVLQPGDIQVPSVKSFPDNDARVYPGEYTVYDNDVDDYPDIMTVNIKEGMWVDIVEDGNSDKHKCP